MLHRKNTQWGSMRCFNQSFFQCYIWHARILVSQLRFPGPHRVFATAAHRPGHCWQCCGRRGRAACCGNGGGQGDCQGASRSAGASGRGVAIGREGASGGEIWLERDLGDGCFFFFYRVVSFGNFELVCYFLLIQDSNPLQILFLPSPPTKKRGAQHISAGFFCPKEIPPWQGCSCGPGAGASGLGGVLGWRAQRRRAPWGGAAMGHGGWCRITTRNARVRREGPRQLGKLGVKKKKKHHEAAENRIRSFLSRDLWKDVLSSCDFVLPCAPLCFSIDSLRARSTFYSDSVGSCQFLPFASIHWCFVCPLTARLRRSATYTHTRRCQPDGCSATFGATCGDTPSACGDTIRSPGGECFFQNWDLWTGLEVFSRSKVEAQLPDILQYLWSSLPFWLCQLKLTTIIVPFSNCKHTSESLHHNGREFL